MKIQLNITATSKKITCEEEVDFKEVYDFLRKTFPDSWKEFKLCTKVVSYSGYPYYWWGGSLYLHGSTSYGTYMTGTTTSVGGGGNLANGTITGTVSYNASTDHTYSTGNLVVGSGTVIGDEPKFTLVKADADFSKDGVYNIEVLSDRTH